MNEKELIFWVIMTVALALVEANTTNLVTIWFAVGALAAGVAAGFGAPIWLQIILFIVVSAITLMLTKPLVRKIRQKGIENTNADRIIGKEAVVETAIDPISGAGQVRVLGQLWSAKSEKDTQIEKGKKVTVIRIEGVKAVVEEKEEA